MLKFTDILSMDHIFLNIALNVYYVVNQMFMKKVIPSLHL